MFSIRSTSSNRELVFSSRKGEYFHVELKGIAMSASTDVWATTDNNGLNAFFQEIASFKNPWQGTRDWGSLEGEFEISATCTTLGHVIFEVKMAGQIGGTEEWKAQFCLETELGQLETIARNASIFFKQ
ncbi:MAG TPA: DUF6228 family protein [Enterococcus faecalis]|nr:DUF6228 family protein [Enterococcus faecalis]